MLTKNKYFVMIAFKNNVYLNTNPIYIDMITTKCCYTEFIRLYNEIRKVIQEIENNKTKGITASTKYNQNSITIFVCSADFMVVPELINTCKKMATHINGIQTSKNSTLDLLIYDLLSIEVKE